MSEQICGVIGATSLVGAALLPRLIDCNYAVAAFSRQKPECEPPHLQAGSVVWNPNGVEISHWVSLAPIRILHELLPMMEVRGARKIVALSTTSLFTKVASKDGAELQMVKEIKEAENALSVWADSHDIEWVVLRPTLIYGFGKDRNIIEIAKMIKRFGFFPLLGSGKGLRQPIHMEDVAQACQSALERPDVKNCSYNISGEEQLSYREMVERVFSYMNKKQRLISVPRWMFLLVLIVLRRFKRFSKWSIAMADRMNQDMVFEYSEATRDLDFKPRPFRLESRDLP